MAPTKMFKKKRNTLYKRKRPTQRWFNKKYSAFDLASKAIRGVKMLKGLINVEKKFIDTTISETPGNTAVFNCLNIASQGSDDINRNGDSIMAKHIKISGHLTINSSNTGSDVVRMIVFADKENRGAFPAATDLLTASGVDTLTNLDNLDRFIILRDRKFVFTPSSGATPQVPISEYITLNTHLKYAGNAGTVADVRQNALFIMWLGIENVNKTQITAYTRLAFYDN